MEYIELNDRKLIMIAITGIVIILIILVGQKTRPCIIDAEEMFAQFEFWQAKVPYLVNENMTIKDIRAQYERYPAYAQSAVEYAVSSACR